MNCTLPRTAHKTDFGTLCLLSCVWIKASMSYFVFWCGHSRGSNGYVLLCNSLVGALPYSYYVMRSFPLCGVRALHPVQCGLTQQPPWRPPIKKHTKNGAPWLSSSRSGWHVLQRRLPPNADPNIRVVMFHSVGANRGPQLYLYIYIYTWYILEGERKSRGRGGRGRRGGTVGTSI